MSEIVSLWCKRPSFRMDLKGRSQSVLLEGHKSLCMPVLSGIPQGTVLGPLLFLCYINDLPNSLTSKIQLYADDVLLFSTVDTLEDCKQLQLDLDNLETWAKIWQMEFNPDKCQHLQITNKHNFNTEYAIATSKK